MRTQKTVEPILFRWATSLLFLSVLGGCILAPTPYDEYSLARAAMTAAREADSAQYAPGLWTKADEAYRTAQKAWDSSEFDVAQKYFKLSTEYAERAENVTRLKKFQTGGGVP